MASARILLVEDEAPIRRLALRMLQMAGHTVDEAENGATALARFQEQPGLYPVVLCDYKLPDLTGDVIMKSMRELSPSTVFIFSSGYSRDMLPGVGQDQDVLFVQKPFTREALADVVAEALDCHARRAQS